MAYGYQTFDTNGDEIIDTSTAVETLIKYDSIVVSLFRNAAFGATYLDYNLPGVSSQQNLEDDYIVQVTNAGSWNVFVAGSYGQGFPVTYQSPGVIRFTGGGGCTTFFGVPTACTAFDIDSYNYDIYVKGVTL